MTGNDLPPNKTPFANIWIMLSVDFGEVLVHEYSLWRCRRRELNRDGTSACPQIKLTEALTTFHMVCFILLSYKFSDIEIWINRASIPAVWSHYKTPRSASSPTLHLLFPADTRTQCDVFLHHQQTTFRLSLRPFVEAEQKMGNRWQSGRYQKDPACLTFQSLPVTITVHLVCKSSGRKMKTERFSCVRFVEQTERLWILVFVH